MKVTADQVQAGDVVMVPEPGTMEFPPGCYMYDGGNWNNFSPIGFFGPPPRPEGELELIVRDGQPVCEETA